MRAQKQHKIEFGDFQTPVSLARQVCLLIARTGFRPASVLEPTCGVGSFLCAALETFPEAKRVLGFEINQQYVEQARSRVASVTPPNTSVEICQADFFLADWSSIIQALPEPILVSGNPPWATNAVLSTLGSNNVPTKSNLDHLRGIDALTGKSNFDISEWMLRKNLEWLKGKSGLLAVLCKTAVARQVLGYAWQQTFAVSSAAIYHLNAQEYFGAAVDACLLMIRIEAGGNSKECRVYASLDAQEPHIVLGWRDGRLVSNVEAYEKWKSLGGIGFKGWRSGIKHDCRSVFELRLENNTWINGLGERVELEPHVVFPLLKGSDLAARREPHRWIVVPQQKMSDDPGRLRAEAPKTWRYLAAHAHLLDRRKSAIYKSRPPFSIFGVGLYSFAPCKVAISALYKRLDFVRVLPFRGKPVVLDDTCYFFPCQSEEECNVLYELVTSQPALEFFSALVFWDAKRPITAQLLNSLDLAALARFLGKANQVTRSLAARQRVEYVPGAHQQLLFGAGDR